MKMNRNIVRRLTLKEDTDDGYVQAEKSELISVMWEITRDAWSLVREEDAERRLQRDVAVFIGRKG